MSAELRLVRWADRDRADMRALAKSIERLWRSVAVSARYSAEPIARPPAAPPEEPTDLEKARALLRQRRDRAAIFGDHARLFADPAWYLLLTLFARGEGEGQVTVAALAAEQPGSGEHWLRALDAEGLTRRWRTADGTAVVGITHKGTTLMHRYLERL